MWSALKMKLSGVYLVLLIVLLGMPGLSPFTLTTRISPLYTFGLANRSVASFFQIRVSVPKNTRKPPSIISWLVVKMLDRGKSSSSSLMTPVHQTMRVSALPAP